MEDSKILIAFTTKEQFDELYTNFERQLNIQSLDKLEAAYKVKTILDNYQLQYADFKKNESDKINE